jgi:hypothetical protein
MKSYTLRPDIFTLNVNFTLSGTVSGKDVEGDWISLLLMIVVFRTFVYVITCYMMSNVMSDRGRLEPCRSVCTCHSDVYVS